jgi:hypothetical protein
VPRRVAKRVGSAGTFMKMGVMGEGRGDIAMMVVSASLDGEFIVYEVVECVSGTWEGVCYVGYLQVLSVCTTTEAGTSL